MLRVGIVLAAMPALACSSASELEKVHTQLDEIHFELLELRKQAPSKAEVEAMGAGLGADIGGVRESQADVARELEVLAERIRQLESKLDDTTFRLTQLAQQIEATNQELQAVRSATETARVAPAPPPPVTPNPTDPQALYDTAYNDYARGAYDLAILGFRQYLESHPDTDLADNAAYWIGECYFLQGKFEKAIEQFDDVLTSYGRSDRDPSALLKKGFSYLELGRVNAGADELQKVACEYAKTDEARLARQRLLSLGIDVDCKEP